MRYRASKRTGIKNIYILAVLVLLMGIVILGKEVREIGEVGVKPPETGWAAEVYDGDTFKLTNGMTVRMKGIEAPSEGAGKEKAKTELERMIIGRQLVLKYEAQAVDDFGRLAAWVWVDGKLVQQELVDRKLVISNFSNLSNLGGSGTN